jgi:uncharacterized protein (DUF2267 family)
MARNGLASLEHSVLTTRSWVHELARDLGDSDDERQALRVLRVFLHAIRDRLPVNEAAHLAAQLPELLRGIYYEGWRPGETPHRYHDLDTFLDRMARDGMLTGNTQAVSAAEAAGRVLRRHISKGEIDKVCAVLPPPVAALLR